MRLKREGCHPSGSMRTKWHPILKGIEVTDNDGQRENIL
jgi:hypothetical protein